MNFKLAVIGEITDDDDLTKEMIMGTVTSALASLGPKVVELHQMFYQAGDTLKPVSVRTVKQRNG